MRILVAGALLLLSCGGGAAGACEGVAGSIKYCFDNTDADTCQSYSTTQMNSAVWTDYPGQTCETRGCRHPGGSKC
jgi:hypothetical protein